jgi:phage gpG-like protein
MTTTGGEEIYRKAMRTSVAAAALRPALEKIGKILRSASEQTFKSQGRRGGGSWKNLKPASVRRKMREGQDPRIMFATGALFRSMTTRRSSRNIELIEGAKITVGSSLPYSEVQNRERDLIKLTRTDVKQINKTIGDHLVGHWRGRRRKGLI